MSMGKICSSLFCCFVAENVEEASSSQPSLNIQITASRILQQVEMYQLGYSPEDSMPFQHEDYTKNEEFDSFEDISFLRSTYTIGIPGMKYPFLVTPNPDGKPIETEQLLQLCFDQKITHALTIKSPNSKLGTFDLQLKDSLRFELSCNLDGEGTPLRLCQQTLIIKNKKSTKELNIKNLNCSLNCNSTIKKLHASIVRISSNILKNSSPLLILCDQEIEDASEFISCLGLYNISQQNLLKPSTLSAYVATTLMAGSLACGSNYHTLNQVKSITAFGQYLLEDLSKKSI